MFPAFSPTCTGGFPEKRENFTFFLRGGFPFHSCLHTLIYWSPLDIISLFRTGVYFDFRGEGVVGGDGAYLYCF